MTTTHELTPEIQAQVVAAIDYAKALPGVKVELIGAWVWVSGNTKPVKDDLKAGNFKWHSKRKMWYLPTVKSRGKGRDMDAIRDHWGATTIKDA